MDFLQVNDIFFRKNHFFSRKPLPVLTVRKKTSTQPTLITEVVVTKIKQ